MSIVARDRDSPRGGGHSSRKGMRVGLDGKTPFFEMT